MSVAEMGDKNREAKMKEKKKRQVEAEMQAVAKEAELKSAEKDSRSRLAERLRLRAYGVLARARSVQLARELVVLRLWLHPHVLGESRH